MGFFDLSAVTVTELEWWVLRLLLEINNSLDRLPLFFCLLGKSTQLKHPMVHMIMIGESN